MAIAIELRTACERCGDPLPVNRFATRVPCWACLHDNPLSPEHWAHLLRGPLEDAWTLSEGEGRTDTIRAGTRTFELRWSVVADPKEQGRKPPPELVGDLFPGVTRLVGEETDAPKTRQNVAFQCPQCAGALQIDGRSRTVDCSYCHASTLLSDEAWRRLHPVHAQRAWVLVVQDGARRSEPFPAMYVYDVVAADGRLYLVADRDGRGIVAAADASDDGLVVRWQLDAKGVDALTRIAVVGDEVWVARPQRHEARRVARADGADRGRIGGVEPAGAKVHHLDLRGVADWAGQPDGTVVALIGYRLVRYDGAGRGIPTWPRQTGLWGWFASDRQRPLYTGAPMKEDPDSFLPEREVPIPVAEGLGAARPEDVIGLTSRLASGPKGDLFVFDGQKLHRYGRDGAIRWTKTLPGAAGVSRPAVGADGTAWVASLDEDGEHTRLFRVSPAGEVRALETGRLGYVSALVATGERVWVFGTSPGEVRILDHDGGTVRVSGAAVDADREAGDAAADDDWG